MERGSNIYNNASELFPIPDLITGPDTVLQAFGERIERNKRTSLPMQFVSVCVWIIVRSCLLIHRLSCQQKPDLGHFSVSRGFSN